jgi:hypothetical protein
MATFSTDAQLSSFLSVERFGDLLRDCSQTYISSIDISLYKLSGVLTIRASIKLVRKQTILASSLIRHYFLLILSCIFSWKASEISFAL